MTIDWFEVNNAGLVSLKPEAKTIPEIVTFLSSLHKKKEDPEKYWQYIWHLVNSRSPYEAYTDDVKRDEQVANDFLKSNPPKDKDLKAIVDRYRDTRETPSKRLLKAARKATRQISEFLETQETIDLDNIDQVTKVLEKVGKMIESLDKIEEKVKKEITNEERVRGGGSVRQRER